MGGSSHGVRWIWGKAVTVLAATLLLALAFAASGCGGDGSGGEREGGAETVSDLSSWRFRPALGSVYRYLRNAVAPEEMEGVPVNFSLEGDWDFTDETGGVVQTVTVVEPSSAPGAERFPGADLCLKGESAGEIIHRFYIQDDMARSLLGMYIQAEGGRESWCTYSPPLTELVFPLAPEKTQEEEVSYIDSEGYSFKIAHQLTVLGTGAMRVPAGEFPLAALIQDYEVLWSEEDFSSRISYKWYVPEVGQVAGITSLPGEGQAAFNRASSFWRLLSFETAE